MYFTILENCNITVTDGGAHMYASYVTMYVYVTVGQETQGLELFCRMPSDAFYFTGEVH